MRILLLGCQKIIYLLDKRVSVSAVNGASVGYRLASRGRTAKTVHTDSKEELRRSGIVIKNVADYRILCY